MDHCPCSKGIAIQRHFITTKRHSWLKGVVIINERAYIKGGFVRGNAHTGPICNINVSERCTCPLRRYQSKHGDYQPYNQEGVNNYD